MYCMSVSKEHKEVFQISFYLYCTLTKEKRKRKRKKMQYTITSKKANILTTYYQLKSFPLINYILIISFHAYSNTAENVLNGNLHTVQMPYILFMVERTRSVL